MCVTRNIYGYVCRDDDNTFLYCCSNCTSEFNSGYEFQLHTFEHDVENESTLDIHENHSVQNDDSKEDDQETAGINGSDGGTIGKTTLKNQCIVCSRRFRKHSNLIRHLKTHTENRPTNECEICGKSVFDLKVHLKTHSNETPHKCTECPATFRYRSALHDHISKHTDGSKQLICSFCEVVVFSSRDFTRHIAKCRESMPEITLERNIQNSIQISSRKSQDCVLCGAKVKNLKIHLQSHKRERPFPCPIASCEKTFTQTGHRNLHVRQTHNIVDESIDLSCEACSGNFESLPDLEDHMKQAHMTNGSFCKICNNHIAPGVIRSHIKTHICTQRKRHKCTICPTSFQRSDHLKKHIRIHCKDKPFQCEYCEDCFFSMSAIKRHMRLMHSKSGTNEVRQTARETAICSTCGKFVKNIELHMRVHSGEKPFKCTYGTCSMAFAQKNNLVNHIRRHTGEKPYRCSPCNKSFHSACALNAHKRRHKSSEVQRKT